jgi:hypothetical protein
MIPSDKWTLNHELKDDNIKKRIQIYERTLIIVGCTWKNCSKEHWNMPKKYKRNEYMIGSS